MSLAQEHSHQSVLIEVLKTALEPNPIKKKIDIILDYLLSLPHLQFASKAALFFVEQDSETLALIVSKGFPHPESISCCETRFGLCHCGQVAESGKMTFFNTPPPCSISQEFPGHFPETTVFPSSRMVNLLEYSRSM